MCNLIKEIDINSIIGYKIAIKSDGKYYSPTTGIEYKHGRVTIPKRQVNRVNSIVSDLLEENSSAFSKDMVGRTCVIIDYLEAKYILNEWRTSCGSPLCLLRMRISENLMYGFYGNSNLVFGGMNIVSFYKQELD